MIEQLEQDGYCIAKGLFDPQSDLQPLETAYLNLLDTMCHAYLKKANRSLPEAPTHDDFAEKFVLAMGASGGFAFEHLSPTLNIQFDQFRWQSDLPSAQVPELFALMRHPRLLNVLERVLGGDIFSMSSYLLNFKLTPGQLQRMHDTAERMGKDIPMGFRYGLQLTETPWHRDPNLYPRNVLESQVIIVWIPLSQTDEENGCLKVLPGSHKKDLGSFPFPEHLTRDFVSLPVEVGDVIFMNDKTYHASHSNCSVDRPRWALNFRYIPVGQASYQPYLPGFIARSHSHPERVLRDPELWRLMWHHAFAYHQQKGCPLRADRAKAMSLAEANAFTRFWHDLTPDHESWLALNASSPKYL